MFGVAGVEAAAPKTCAASYFSHYNEAYFGDYYADYYAAHGLQIGAARAGLGGPVIGKAAFGERFKESLAVDVCNQNADRIVELQNRLSATTSGIDQAFERCEAKCLALDWG